MFHANLDILAELWDANGTVLATSNPADALNASLQATVILGEILLEGVGAAAESRSRVTRGTRIMGPEITR